MDAGNVWECKWYNGVLCMKDNGLGMATAAMATMEMDQIEATIYHIVMVISYMNAFSMMIPTSDVICERLATGWLAKGIG